MKRLLRKEIVLFGIGIVLEVGDKPNWDHLLEVFSINRRYLNRIINHITKLHLLKQIGHRKKGKQDLSLTMLGKTEYNSIKKRILSRTIITFYSDRRIPIEILFSYVKNPYDRIWIVEQLFMKKKSIKAILESLSSRRADERFMRLEDEVKQSMNRIGTIPLDKFLQRYSIYGISPKVEEGTLFTDGNRSNWSIRDAEMIRRQGRVYEARCIYKNIIDRNEGLDNTTWIMCIIGIVQCLLYENETIISLELLDKALETTEQPVHKSILLKNKADILQDIDRIEEASTLYDHCLKVFKEREYPILRTAVLNNLGVLYNKKGRVKEATGLWEDSLRIARKLNLPWIISMVSINLSDVYSMQGRSKLAQEYLRNARRTLSKLGDLEGLSAVDFNLSLVQIDLGHINKAYQYFEKSKLFSLSYLIKAKERDEVFRKRLESSGKKISEIP